MSQRRHMRPIGPKEVQAAWDRNALKWDADFSVDGDDTRRYLTDGPLWSLTGNVQGLEVLDLGCGNGYLSRALANAGARVTGVDISENMLAAAAGYPAPNHSLRYHHLSATDLSPLSSSTFDIVVSNYVLQDVPDYSRAVREVHRLLRPAGLFVLAISHPCFSCGPRQWQPGPDESLGDTGLSFAVDHYFAETTYLLDGWEGFEPVPYFHRTLSSYWRTFSAAGFVIDEFVEPELNEQGRADLPPARVLEYERIPIGCLFRLIKPASNGS